MDESELRFGQLDHSTEQAIGNTLTHDAIMNDAIMTPCDALWAAALRASSNWQQPRNYVARAGP